MKLKNCISNALCFFHICPHILIVLLVIASSTIHDQHFIFSYFILSNLDHNYIFKYLRDQWEHYRSQKVFKRSIKDVSQRVLFKSQGFNKALVTCIMFPLQSYNFTLTSVITVTSNSNIQVAMSNTVSLTFILARVNIYEIYLTVQFKEQEKHLAFSLPIFCWCTATLNVSKCPHSGHSKWLLKRNFFIFLRVKYIFYILYVFIHTHFFYCAKRPLSVDCLRKKAVSRRHYLYSDCSHCSKTEKSMPYNHSWTTHGNFEGNASQMRAHTRTHTCTR